MPLQNPVSPGPALIGLAFIHRHDLEIIAGRFDDKVLHDLPTRCLLTVMQFEPERKRDSYLVVTLRLNRDLARQPECPVRPTGIVTLQIPSNGVAILDPVIVITDAIGKKFDLGPDVGIKSSQDKCSHVIADPLCTDI